MGTGTFSGLNSGTGTLSPSVWHSPCAILSSPSATLQGAELLSALSLSVALSLVAGVVAGSHTWFVDGLSVAAVLALRQRWAQHVLRAVGRWWAGHWVRDCTVHSTNVSKFARGPSLANGTLYVEFKLAS